MIWIVFETSLLPRKRQNSWPYLIWGAPLFQRLHIVLCSMITAFSELERIMQHISLCCCYTLLLCKTCKSTAYGSSTLAYKGGNNCIWLLFGSWMLEKKPQSPRRSSQTKKPRCLMWCQGLLKYVIHSICSPQHRRTAHQCQLPVPKTERGETLAIMSCYIL